jgi:hypothetical protein
MQTACIAKAKLVYVKNKNTYKVVIAFNAHKVIKPDGSVKYNFPTQAKCNYVSGDLCAETLAQDVQRVISSATSVLRTNNIEFVE